jgi:hypothetical protein
VSRFIGIFVDSGIDGFGRYRAGDIIIFRAGLLGHEVLRWKAGIKKAWMGCSPCRKAVVLYTTGSALCE